MDRKARRPPPDDTPLFPAPAAALPPAAAEACEGLLLAFLGRRRLLVLIGNAGDRPATAGTLAARAAADGALVLPVVARPGMLVEDLVRRAGQTAFPPGKAPADFETLVAALDERLDFAGSGVLAVEEAHHLPPAVLADLVELSREETTHGRFLQILLSGASELERTLARPGLDRALHDLGVVYRLGAAGPPRPRLVTDDAHVAIPTDWGTAAAFPAIPAAAGRRPMVAAWTIGAVLLVAAGTGVALSLPAGPWSDRAQAALVWASGTWNQGSALALAEGRALADRLSGWFEREVNEERMVALSTTVPVMPPPAAFTPLVPTPPQPPAPVAEIPEPHSAAPSPAPAPSPAAPATTLASPVPLPPAPLPSAPLPSSVTASLPMPAPVASAPPPDPANDPTRLQRVQELATEARRQIAAKRLTTPPGDNALETVQRLQAEAPDSSEATELLSAMAETYRRWGGLAERGGAWDEARRFYERALMVMPGDSTASERLRVLEGRDRRTGSTVSQASAGLPAPPPPQAPAHQWGGIEYGRLIP